MNKPTAAAHIDMTPDSVNQALDQGLGRLREATQQVRESALRASDGTVRFIQHAPVKSVLLAAATGAALMALLSLTVRRD